MRRNRQAAAFVALAAVVLMGTGDLSAQQRQPKEGFVPDLSGVRPVDYAPDVVGTIVLDNNIAASRDGALAQPIGNRFAAPNVPPGVHSIAAISFKLAGCFTTPYVGAQAHIHDINPTAMTAMQLAIFSAMAGPGVNCNAAALYTGMVPAPIMGHTGPFFGGILNTPFAGCAGMTGIGGTCEGVALTMGTMDPGMGFHGHRLVGGMYTPIAPVKNAIFRVTGDNLPVELMGFGVN